MAEASGNGRLDRLEGAVETLTAAVGSLTDVTRLIADQLNRLAEAHIQTEENMAELAESQQHADQRLNALIATVDGLIRRPTPPPPPQ